MNSQREAKDGVGMTSKRTRSRMVSRLRESGITDQVILDSMASVPRHLFVEEALSSRAYDDVSLPIGFGQTISQPYTVARSCELARADQPVTRVLEIGTGCGYQAAVLSNFSKEVYSIERISSLLSKARARLRNLNYRNVRVKHSDGSGGLENLLPLDAIVVAAGLDSIPDYFIKLLAVGGRVVAPIGREVQQLTQVVKRESRIEVIKHETVTFVPFLSGVVVK